MSTLAARLEIKWDGSNWTDESAYLESASGQATLQTEIPGNVGGGVAAEATMVLRNADNRFSPDNSLSPIYAYIQDGKLYHKRVRLSVSVDGGGTYTTIFDGYIEDYRKRHLRREVEFHCLDYAGVLQGRKITTALLQDYRTDEYISLLATSSEGGLSAGDLSLERGIVRVPWLWADDESIWEEMLRAAEVEGGRVYFRPSDGKLIFENGYHDVANVTSQETYTVASFKDIEHGFQFQDIYNQIVVEFVAWSLGPRQVIFQSDEAWVIPAGASVDFDVRFNSPAKTVYVPTTNTSKPDRGDWIAVTPAGQVISSSVTVAVNAGAQVATVTVTNNHATFAAYIPRLRVQGIPLVGSPTRKYAVEDATSQSDYGRRDFQIPNLPFIQANSVAKYLADMSLARLKTPKRLYTLPIRGNPARRCGQRVTVQEADSGTDRDVFIRALDWNYSSRDGYQQSLELIDATIFTDTPYFVWNTTKWGGASTPGAGKLWY